MTQTATRQLPPTERFEGIVTEYGVVIYRTPPVYDRNAAFAWAVQWTHDNDRAAADVTTAPRR